MLCRNGLQNLLRAPRLQFTGIALDFDVATKAVLVGAVNRDSDLLVVHSNKFDDVVANVDGLHGKYLVGQPEETEGHARVGPHLLPATRGAAFVRVHRCER